MPTLEPPVRRARLPAAPGELHGRRALLDEVERMLARGARLATLFGPPGAGKTRLALEVARRAHGRGESVGWLDLTAATTASALCAALADALELRVEPRSEEDVTSQLGRALAARGPGLWVLDNFEQLVATSLPTIGAWVALAPSTAFLVTSRERLRCSFESVVEVGPMALPETAGGAALECEAVRFFIERVRAQRPYEPGDADGPVLAEIARRLDGLPLALELAAARCLVLSPRALLDRLDQRFELLSHPTDRLAHHQATLEATLAWSWAMLGDAERTALARASVFHGGFTVEAAEAVLTDGAGPPALELVQSLREKSLLRAADTPDGPRFVPYESVREYARRRLAGGADEARALDAHAAHYAERGEGWARRVEASGDAEALEALARERDNLAAVVDSAARVAPSHPRRRDAARAALALHAMLKVRGWLDPHLSVLDAALAPERAPDDDGLRAALSEARGYVLRLGGRLDEAGAALDEAGELARRSGRPDVLARCLRNRGALALAACDLEAAREAFEAALPLAEGLVDRGTCFLSLAVQAERSGALDLARAHGDEALSLFRRAGNARAVGFCLSASAEGHLHRGELDRAAALHREAHTAFVGAGDDANRILTLANFALIDQLRGRFDAAEQAYGKARDGSRALGMRRIEGMVASYAATLLHQRGLLDEARALYADALPMLADTGETLVRCFAGSNLAALLAEQGALREAEEAFARARLDDPQLAGASALQRAHLELGRALRDADGGRAEVARRAWRAATAAADEGATGAPGASVFELLARDLLDAAIARHGLRVADDGSWAAPAGAPRVELAAQAPRRLLAALASHAIDHPAEPLALGRLLELGWPGERVVARAIANRIRVALSALRSAGIAGIVHRDGGYLLDPTVPVRIVRAGR